MSDEPRTALWGNQSGQDASQRRIIELERDARVAFTQARLKDERITVLEQALRDIRDGRDAPGAVIARVLR
jgi:hypothetical protein